MGSTFPFSLSLWLTRKFVAIEYIVEWVLPSPDDDTWVLSKEQNHWTMTSVHDAVFTNNIRYDTLLSCISVNRLNLSQRFCIGRKRPQSTFHIIVDNSRNSCIKECFTFVDCIKTSSSSSDCDPICVVSWCHDEFLKCLRDVDAIERNNDYVGKIKLMSLYDAMERMPTDVKFINQPQPIIMNKACLCCKSDVDGAVHVCGRVDTSNEKYDITHPFEKEFNLATCNEEYVSTTNLSMLDTESKLFLYKVDKKRQQEDHHHENIVGNSSSGGKDTTTLKHSALNTLTETMDSFKEKCDICRPGNDTIRANRVCMCLSRSELRPSIRVMLDKRGRINFDDHLYNADLYYVIPATLYF